MQSRKERRQEARTNGVSFEPQYNGKVIDKTEYNRVAEEYRAKLEEANNKFKNAQTDAERNEILENLTEELTTEV